ncbi:macrophage mannose receptor 1-like [Cyprinodon tularosa]|uniref:macrophage mannose receptor 1-like n=1 Tax=Cyprinodon tularosa TaxID=77115 RepID=UPI0018E1FCE1|nr:macrophage mannose receptor 1-like [Cyprinodon tularosa]
MVKKGRSELMLLILFMLVFWLEAKIPKTITIPSQTLTWHLARKYCQDNYIDMVTWDTVDMDLLTDWLVSQSHERVWIGLHEDPEHPSIWRMIDVRTGNGLTGDDVSNSTNWASPPQSGASCGSYSTTDRKWHSTVCSERLKWMCYDDKLVLVKENKMWEDAMNHCKGMSSESNKCDLVSMSGSSDFNYVRNRIYGATSDQVWIGLRFLGGEWWWSDGEMLEQEATLPGCPSKWKHCGTVSNHNKENWITRDCSEKRNFMCHCKAVA